VAEGIGPEFKLQYCKKKKKKIYIYIYAFPNKLYDHFHPKINKKATTKMRGCTVTGLGLLFQRWLGLGS
jgi:hypothetical protein